MNQFESSIQEVETLLSLAASDAVIESSLGSRSNQRAAANAVYRSATVMLIAHFEGFVKSALIDFIDALIVRQPPARRIPTSLLDLMSRNFFNDIAQLTSVDRSIRLRKSLPHYAQMWDPNTVIQPRHLNGKLLEREFTNAGHESLARTFEAIGLENIVDRLDEASNRNLELTEDGTKRIDVSAELEFLISQRNAIAHGDGTVTPTREEVARARALLVVISEEIECATAEQLENICRL